MDADSGSDVEESEDAEGYADGGLIRGKGTGTSDSILARVSNGEFVFTADAVKHWGTQPLYEMLNLRSPKLPAFATGGLVNLSKLNQPIQNNWIQQALQQEALQPFNLTIGNQAMPSVRSNPDDLRELARALSRAR